MPIYKYKCDMCKYTTENLKPLQRREDFEPCPCCFTGCLRLVPSVIAFTPLKWKP
ncbi:hypothetical protein KAU11_06435 [Candidatus Babeliales bacterium]|nr:hypothetical protein [Candidatus Babeliales bacterium]